MRDASLPSSQSAVARQHQNIIAPAVAVACTMATCSSLSARRQLHLPMYTKHHSKAKRLAWAPLLLQRSGTDTAGRTRVDICCVSGYSIGIPDGRRAEPCACGGRSCLL